ncbi:Glycosyl transferase family 2 [Chryseobacterium formosense]|uniref:glycosyltransferase n=1 Tax=Chryseobacterium formosense TaxID=236814 RepID=UPI0008E1052E|nr:glycosyltransferase [Chryseobacterium formosense]SFT33312.1 Glycosyl transferase family 2 [Chryseobacterium formosense]
MERVSISVCMASYNGEKYIERQIDSILSQLITGDELIIVDDSSKDNTVSLIKKYNSNFIRLVENEKNIGHVKTFEKALALAKNKYICLADQDDIWIEGRLQKLEKKIRKEKVLLVASNFKPKFENNSNYREFKKLETEKSSKYIVNILRIFQGKSTYYGCTMMIDENLLKFILPFPEYIEAHDLWIAMNANMLKSVCHLKDDTLLYTVHQNNVSLKKRSFAKKIRARFYFWQAIVDILKRINS